MMKRLLFLFLLLATGAYGQGLFRYENILINQNGTPIVGANVWVCSGNVTPNFGNSPPCTLATVYSDLAGTLQISQPMVSTAGSTTQTGSFAFVVAPGTYTLAIRGAGIQASDLITVPNVSGVTTANNLAGPGSITGTFSGSPTLSGNVNFTGVPTFTNALSAGNINNVLAVDGTQYTTLAAAFAACPSSGCTIDMRGASTVTALGNFDPGTKPVTLLLGPYNYTVGTITIESNLHVIGVGATNLTSNNTTNPVFTISQVNIPSSNVLLKDFSLNGGVGNTTQDGIFLDCSGVTGGGLFYSRIEGLVIQGFNGVSIHLRGRVNDFLSNHQFIDWIGNTVYRGTAGGGGSGEALRIEGSASNITFYRNVLSSQTAYQLGSNIYLGAYISGGCPGSCSGYPLSVHFRDTIIQSANIGVTMNGTASVDFRDSHWENNKTGGFLFQGTWFNTDFMIDHNYFASNQFVNASTGYVVNFSAGGGLNYGKFTNNIWGEFGGTQPDAVFRGIPANVSNLVAIGNTANTVPFQFTFANLPPAANNAGNYYPISDSTTISAEGQACAGSSTNNALAWSNGTSYKCF